MTPVTNGSTARVMMNDRTSPSVSYSIWLKRILDAHASRAWDAEATEVREREDEELNDIWTEIADDQKVRLWGLSADLNTLRDREAWVEADWLPMTKDELGRAQTEAFQRKKWDTFLECLRRPPRFLRQNMIDYLRGRAWREMGHPEVAVLFFDTPHDWNRETQTTARWLWNAWKPWRISRRS